MNAKKQQGFITTALTIGALIAIGLVTVISTAFIMSPKNRIATTPHAEGWKCPGGNCDKCGTDGPWVKSDGCDEFNKEHPGDAKAMKPGDSGRPPSECGGAEKQCSPPSVGECGNDGCNNRYLGRAEWEGKPQKTPSELKAEADAAAKAKAEADAKLPACSFATNDLCKASNCKECSSAGCKPPTATCKDDLSIFPCDYSSESACKKAGCENCVTAGCQRPTAKCDDANYPADKGLISVYCDYPTLTSCEKDCAKCTISGCKSPTAKCIDDTTANISACTYSNSQACIDSGCSQCDTTGCKSPTAKCTGEIIPATPTCEFSTTAACTDSKCQHCEAKGCKAPTAKCDDKNYPPELPRCDYASHDVCTLNCDLCTNIGCKTPSEKCQGKLLDPFPELYFHGYTCNRYLKTCGNLQRCALNSGCYTEFKNCSDLCGAGVGIDKTNTVITVDQVEQGAWSKGTVYGNVLACEPNSNPPQGCVPSTEQKIENGKVIAEFPNLDPKKTVICYVQKQEGLTLSPLSMKCVPRK